MADFAPPTGPPPPKVPEGWKAVWNEQYKEWFYVNIYTKKSQWDKPAEPIYAPPGGEAPPDGPPPYVPGESKPVVAEKTGLSSNNPYGPAGPIAGAGAGPAHDISEDERFARQLQAEEDARAHGRPSSRGASDSYYNSNNQAPGYGQSQYGQAAGQPNPYTGQYDNQDSGDRGKSKGGLLGKLKSKIAGGSSHGGGMMAGGYGGHSGYPQQQPMYAQQPAYGGYYPPAGAPYGRPGRRPGGGMGVGTGAALGGAAGLAGGLLLADAATDGFGGDDGGFGGDDGGGDFGGDGGGDFGGDMGGGDF